MVSTEEILSMLENEDISIKKKAILKAGDMKVKDAVPFLLRFLKSHPNSVVRNMSARALGKINDKEHRDSIIAALIEATQDPDYYVKLNATWALGKLKAVEAIPVLSSLTDPRNRLYVASGHLSSDKAVSSSQANERIREEGIKYSDVIINAIKALGNIGDPQALPALISALQDEDDGDVRCAACYALGKIGDRSAVPHLIEALNDKQWYVRRDAAKALMKLKDPSAIPYLEKKTRDMYDEVREWAKKAMNALSKEK